MTGTPVRKARYAELQVTTNFSFLEGGSHPHELVARAAELGLDAIAITDRNSLAGIVRAHLAARELRSSSAKRDSAAKEFRRRLGRSPFRRRVAGKGCLACPRFRTGWLRRWSRPGPAEAGLVLEPILEPIFLPDSYGYRPEKSALDAVAIVRPSSAPCGSAPLSARALLEV